MFLQPLEESLACVKYFVYEFFHKCMQLVLATRGRENKRPGLQRPHSASEWKLLEAQGTRPGLVRAAGVFPADHCSGVRGIFLAMQPPAGSVTLTDML